MWSLLVLACLALLCPAPAAAAKDGVCILYADDNSRSFFFSGVSPAGALAPQLLALPTWDSLLVGLNAGEDDNTFYIVPEGVGANPNMTIATLRTSAGGNASVSYATLGAVPGFDVPGAYTYMKTMHLDPARAQVVAMLQGTAGPPPRRRGLRSRRRAVAGSERDAGQPPHALGARDPGDLFLVIADAFPSNGTVSRVWLDLSEDDMRWGEGVLSGVSAFDGSSYWVNVVGGSVPSEQAIYGFPLNGSAATAVPYGAVLNVDHLFYSTARSGLLVVLTSDQGAPSLASFSPPSAAFEVLFTWNTSGGLQDEGVFDVSPDGASLLSVLVDSKGENPRLVVLDLLTLKEVSRTPLQGFTNALTVCDVNFCNVA